MFTGSREASLVVLNIILKILYSTTAMPSEADNKDQGKQEQGAKAWQGQGRPGRNQRRQGNRGGDPQRGRQPRFEGREPRLQGHIYDWTGERTPERYIRTMREIST